jgi:hypothetical protein
MAIRLSDLSPELQKQILQISGTPAPKARRPRVLKVKSRLMRRCSCGFEIFRPDGIYPDTCDACGKPADFTER